MKAKHYVGRLISIRFTDRKTPIYGYVVDYSDDWTLMKYNPVDYIIDGWIILRHKNIEGFRASAEEKFREKVVRLKGIKIQKSDLVPLADLGSILRHLTVKHGLFQLYTKSETACYVGRVNSVDEKQLVIDSLNAKGKWDGRMKFRPNDIRVIEFDTDYLNSLKLVSKGTGSKS
jgi:hypothetical protein